MGQMPCNSEQVTPLSSRALRPVATAEGDAPPVGLLAEGIQWNSSDWACAAAIAACAGSS
jgi:hypothetical protein